MKNCPHRHVIPVESILDPDEILAGLCGDCGRQLPPREAKGIHRIRQMDRYDVLCGQLDALDRRIANTLLTPDMTTSLRDRRNALWMEAREIAVWLSEHE